MREDRQEGGAYDGSPAPSIQGGDESGSPERGLSSMLSPKADREKVLRQLLEDSRRRDPCDGVWREQEDGEEDGQRKRQKVEIEGAERDGETEAAPENMEPSTVAAGRSEEDSLPTSNREPDSNATPFKPAPPWTGLRRSAHPPIAPLVRSIPTNGLNHIQEGTYGIVFRARSRSPLLAPLQPLLPPSHLLLLGRAIL